jgi:branched-chain amino acid transport system ATP-binding protein
MTTTELLRVDGLQVSYGPVQALQDVTLTVHEGEVVTVVGSNGAGKTTLLKTVVGLIPARAGRVTFLGQDITAFAANRRVRLGLSLVPEGRHIFARMSVRENLLMGAYSRAGKGMDGDLERCFGFFPQLKDRLHQRAGTLSGGEQQMLAMARSLMLCPRLLLLDEPSLGLAPQLVRETFKLVERLRRLGVTILMVEQMARLALRYADRAYVLEHGRVVHAGRATDVRQDPKILSAYLGVQSPGSEPAAWKDTRPQP